MTGVFMDDARAAGEQVDYGLASRRVRLHTPLGIYIVLVSILLALVTQLCVGVYWAGELHETVSDLNARVTRIERVQDEMRERVATAIRNSK